MQGPQQAESFSAEFLRAFWTDFVAAPARTLRDRLPKVFRRTGELGRTLAVGLWRPGGVHEANQTTLGVLGPIETSKRTFKFYFATTVVLAILGRLGVWKMPGEPPPKTAFFGVLALLAEFLALLGYFVGLALAIVYAKLLAGDARRCLDPREALVRVTYEWNVLFAVALLQNVFFVMFYWGPGRDLKLKIDYVMWFFAMYAAHTFLSARRIGIDIGTPTPLRWALSIVGAFLVGLFFVVGWGFLIVVLGLVAS